MSTAVSPWTSPEIADRIDADIERVRKTRVALRVLDAAGKPVSGARVVSEQTSADFHFGANIFMLGGFPTPEQNARYEEAFLHLFNAATVPFYWRGTEVERGKPRYSADSPFLARRPPPDTVIAFCEKHGLRMHGHYLVWDFYKWSVPDWLSKTDTEANARAFEARVREIAERYGDRIKRWDALNESMRTAERFAGGESCAMPASYEADAFVWAKRYFPESVRMDINEVSRSWTTWNLDYLAKIRGLINTGHQIDGIGYQFHLFSDDDVRGVLDGRVYAPTTLFAALDNAAAFGLPVHVSEITLTSPENTPQSQAEQAEAARNLYRLWFSHPSVDSITWWNVPDGGGAPGEDKLRSGLLNPDLSPKPAYHALRDLIHNEWRTNNQGETNADGLHVFRGFSGDYRVRIEHGGKTSTHTVSAAKGAAAETVIRLAS